jgi:hypothetical protein
VTATATQETKGIPAIIVIGLILLGVTFYGLYQNFFKTIRPSKQTQRVTVAYPEQWNRGDFRNCEIGPNDVITGLPVLDCDPQAHDTPRSRMFVMDVMFSGNTQLAPSHSWTCQRTGESLLCKN